MSGSALSGLAAAVAAAAPGLSQDVAAQWVSALSGPMAQYDITTPNRIAGFLGQCAEETGGFVELVEDMSYSALGAHNTWPSRFPTVEAAQPFAHQPEMLANHVYCSRMGNGDEASGDGWEFRGRGLIQTTGRDSYTRLAAALGKSVDDTAGYMATIEGAAEAACWDWNDMGCNPLADAWNMQGLTERVNGGLTAYAARVVNCSGVLATLSAEGHPSLVATAPLMMGDSGPAVSKLQSTLKSVGFYKGWAIDGNYGSATKAAVVSYQVANGLYADGKAGPETLKSLGLTP